MYREMNNRGDATWVYREQVVPEVRCQKHDGEPPRITRCHYILLELFAMDKSLKGISQRLNVRVSKGLCYFRIVHILSNLDDSGTSFGELTSNTYNYK